MPSTGWFRACVAELRVPPIERCTFGDIAVAAHHHAAQAAMEILTIGGNAVDAAIAANAVQGVCEPQTCGIGGDLFALVHQPGFERPAVLNASGRAGSGTDAAELRQSGLKEIPWDHPATATVPGCFDGWDALVSRFGSLPIGDLLAPAIRLAEHGFPKSTELSRSLDRLWTVLEAQPSGRSLFADGIGAGSRTLRPELAATLRLVAQGGRDAFYMGIPGSDISEATNGIICQADLARSQADWAEPLGLDLYGRKAWTAPPNSQGYLTLATLGVFEQLTMSDPEAPEFVHNLIEAYRAVAWERDRLIADPAFAPDTANLLDRRMLISKAEAIGNSPSFHPSSRLAPGGTAYLCVVDRNGLAISLIQSNFMGIGNGIGAGRSGFFLHNRGAGFNLTEGHPNEFAPGKRPLHTLSPTLWTRDGGQLDMVLGTRGGDQQPQLLAQVAANHLIGGDGPGMAQARPRWITDIPNGSGSSLKVESRLAPATIKDLRRRGHEVEVAGSFESGWGPVSLISVDDNGLRVGASDPRVDTASVSVR